MNTFDAIEIVVDHGLVSSRVIPSVRKDVKETCVGYLFGKPGCSEHYEYTVGTQVTITRIGGE